MIVSDILSLEARMSVGSGQSSAAYYFWVGMKFAVDSGKSIPFCTLSYAIEV